MIGRNQEMNQLAGALSRLQAGHGQIICLTGEGGIGKSRLVRELAQLGREFQTDINWHVSESYSFEGSQPYALIQRLLRRVGDIARDDTPEITGRKIRFLADVLPQEQRGQVTNVLSVLFDLQSTAGKNNCRVKISSANCLMVCRP